MQSAIPSAAVRTATATGVAGVRRICSSPAALFEPIPPRPVRGRDVRFRMVGGQYAALLAMALVFVPGPGLRASPPEFGTVEVRLCGRPTAASSSVCGFSVVARAAGPQAALMEPSRVALVSVGGHEQVQISIPIRGESGPIEAVAKLRLVEGDRAEVSFSLGAKAARRTLQGHRTACLEASGQRAAEGSVLRLTTRALDAQAAVRWQDLRVRAGGRWFDVPIAAGAPASVPSPPMPNLRAAIEGALVEWDWRMQDGIGTERAPSTFSAAVESTFRRGDALLAELRAAGVRLGEEAAQWESLRRGWQELAGAAKVPPTEWEALWRRVHRLRRRIVLANPLARVGPLLFVKRVPSAFSHQLTQYYGRDARPGGGIFVLDAPGRSMGCRRLDGGALPQGSYQHPEISWDGERVLFSYCQVDAAPANREAHPHVFYHLYEMAADGSGMRQLTDGPYDDFAPRYLPDDRILFVSTRRGGFHRCGRGPCPVYTLAIAEADGSRPRPVSYHETHEWDPALLPDGRVIYTRWDYVDRHAVHYQQLWSVRPDGSCVRIYYGNNTFNPVGVWEARPVPGSTGVMATAGAHHAMTAGSIILLDVTRGLDGLSPIRRLTPDALFPESEVPVLRAPGGFWHAPVGVDGTPAVSPEASRWPGHCYRTPYPLSEKYFLAAYSFARLVGEPTANPANMFGLYLIDCFGNKELLYRDLNIASLWPVPLRPRPRPAAVPCVREAAERPEGTFFLHDVYQAWPPLPKDPLRKEPLPGDAVKRLRIVQVLPKSTPHINDPPLGIPNASPGKQVLGSVPVEADGSACFRAPAGVPLSFQALDERGRAVQIMRSITYLQPGETLSCVGCHEQRTAAPPSGRMAQALRRPPSPIQPGPDGSRPLCYPILVQPVLQKHCLGCHNREKPEGGVVLSGEPEGHYTVSYNALAPRAAYSAWGGRGGDFRLVNSEPLTYPGHFGARGSPLMQMLLEGHYDVELGPEDVERLATWLDANALFYGTFDRQGQARQQRGERIEGPGVE